MGELLCFKCRKPGHLSRDCDQRTRGRAAPAPDAAEAAPAKEWRGNPVPPRRPEAEISTHLHEHAERIRAALGWLHSCGDPADLYTSEFRRASRLPAVHQCQLRQLAAAQVNESREDH